MADMRDDVIRRLRDAGRTLMMLPMPVNGMPPRPGCVWPGVLQDFWDLAGVADKGSVEERLTALAAQRNAPTLRASQAAVRRLDEVLGWLLMIDQPHHRRVVMARMLAHPVSERPVHSWTQIGKTLGAKRSTVRRWHQDVGGRA